MDIPLALHDVGFKNRLKGYKRRSSTFSSKADVDGLSAFCDIKMDFYGYFQVI